jgi:hypothetical protein
MSLVLRRQMREINTVEPPITHTPRLRPQGMGYWRVWTIRELVKIASKIHGKMFKRYIQLNYYVK